MTAPNNNADQTTVDIHAIVEKGELKDLLEALKSCSARDLDAQNVDGLCPINIAAKADNHAFVRALLGHGASVHGYDKNGYSSLHHAAQDGRVAMVALLIQRGATVDAVEHNQKTPLHIACEKGHVEVVKLLLIRGAWVLASANVRSFFLFSLILRLIFALFIV